MWNIQNTLKNNFNFMDDLENASISFNGNDLINNAPSTFYKSVSRYMHFKSACNMGLDNNNGDVDEKIASILFILIHFAVIQLLRNYLDILLPKNLIM